MIESGVEGGESSCSQMIFSNVYLVWMRTLVFAVRRSLQNGYSDAVCLLSSRLKVDSPRIAAALSGWRLWGWKAQEWFQRVLIWNAQPDPFEIS
jgi:hypothetical protein